MIRILGLVFFVVAACAQSVQEDLAKLRLLKAQAARLEAETKLFEAQAKALEKERLRKDLQLLGGCEQAAKLRDAGILLLDAIAVLHNTAEAADRDKKNTKEAAAAAVLLDRAKLLNAYAKKMCP